MSDNLQPDSDLIQVKIKNWKKYNPRHDVKRNSWFRFETDFFFAPEFFTLSPIDRLTWIFILSLTCRTGKEEESDEESFGEKPGGGGASSQKFDEKNERGIVTMVSLGQISYVLHTESTIIKRSIETLHKLGLIDILSNNFNMIPCTSRARYEHDGNLPATLRNERNETKQTAVMSETEKSAKDQRPSPSSVRGGSGLNLFVLNLFNEIFSGIKRAQRVDGKRTAAIKKLTQSVLKNEDDWRKYFEKIAKTEFFISNRRSTWFDFDWVLNEHNAVKVLEGKYENPKSDPASESAELLKNFFDKSGVEGVDANEKTGDNP